MKHGPFAYKNNQAFLIIFCSHPYKFKTFTINLPNIQRDKRESIPKEKKKRDTRII